MRGVLDTTLCDKVCQWLATGLWFSPSVSKNKLKTCLIYTCVNNSLIVDEICSKITGHANCFEDNTIIWLTHITILNIMNKYFNVQKADVLILPMTKG